MTSRSSSGATSSALRRAQNLRHRYQVTVLQYEQMLRRQDGRCAICDRPPKRALTIDHEHKTGRVRGLLCHFCNYRFLGRGRENPEHHRRAVAYLSSTFDGRAL
jgi:hypothetical protein